MAFDEVPKLGMSSGIDLVSFLAVIRRRLLICLAVFLICVVIAAYVTFTAIPIYKSSTSVLISRDSSKVTLEDVFSMDAAQSSNFNTRISLFKSRKLAATVRSYLEKQGKLSGDLSNLGDIASAIEAIPVRNTRIVEVSVRSVSPQAAAEYANAVAQCFIDSYSEESQRSASFYGTQLKSLEEQVANINGQINAFVRDHGLITPEMWATYRDELSSLRVSTEAKQHQLRVRERRLAEIKEIEKTDKDFTKLLFVREAGIIANLEKTRMELEKDIAVSSQTYGPAHPRIRILSFTLERTLDDIKSVSANLVRDFIEDSEYFAKEVETARQELAKKEVTVRETISLLQQYSKLERDLKATQSLHDVVLQKMRETGMSTSGDVEPTQIIDEATVPTIPVSPKVKLNIALGIILGLILAIAIAYAVDYFDDSVKAPEDIQLATFSSDSSEPSPILGYIGRVEPKSSDEHAQEKLCLLEPKTPFAEAYRSLRTSVVFSFAEPASRAILVSSPGSSEGKTINVTNLAIALAQNDYKTIIVDADMRKPRVHKIFSLGNDKGLSVHLTGNADIQDVVFATEIPNLSVIPCGPIPPFPNELVSGARFKALIESLKGQYDYVIVDSPPGIVADAMVIASVVDGVVVVVRSGMASRRHLKMFFEQMQQANSKVLGVILNDVESKMRYGYNYYSYRYKYGYKYYGSSKEGSDVQKAAS